MKQYKVQFRSYVWVNIVVEAESIDDAIDKASEEHPYISSYAGNGGMDKLIGVSGDNMSIEVNNEFDSPSRHDVIEL